MEGWKVGILRHGSVQGLEGWVDFARAGSEIATASVDIGAKPGSSSVGERPDEGDRDSAGRVETGDFGPSGTAGGDWQAVSNNGSKRNQRMGAIIMRYVPRYQQVRPAVPNATIMVP